MEIYTLSVEDVIEIYHNLTGYCDSPVRPDGLESAVALPMASMFGQDLYRTIFEKAAALMRSIAENQPFLDGNKRTAWASAQVFLDLNGIDVFASVEDAVALMLAIASKEISVEGIAEFLAQRCSVQDTSPAL